VTAESLGGDAAAVFHVDEALPGYFEIQASVLAVKPTAGWKANSYVIFDYQSAMDFKFAGIDVSTNKLVMGHRDASGWHVDEQAVVRGGVKADKFYNVLLAVNGTNVTLLVDNQLYFTHTFAPGSMQTAGCTASTKGWSGSVPTTPAASLTTWLSRSCRRPSPWQPRRNFPTPTTCWILFRYLDGGRAAQTANDMTECH
jgi:hypothetical protein